MKKVINNHGLLQLLTKSTKPLAKLFMDKYITEIMPTITNTGKYISSDENMVKIKQLNKKINKLKEKVNNLSNENTLLEDKHKYQPSSNGYAYIHQTKCNVKGKSVKCYKFGVADEIKSRISSYKTGNPTYKMLYYIPLNFDKDQLEDCIASIIQPHQVKKRTETVSFISLTELKNTINNCAKIIAEHICYCDYCQNKLNFNDIDVHNCKDIAKLTYISLRSNKIKGSKKGTKKGTKNGSKKGSKKVKSSKSSKNGSKKESKKESKKVKSSNGSKKVKSSNGS